MAINYVCKHCHVVLGSLERNHSNETQLGLLSLTPAERRNMIAYDSDGGLTVKVTCDYCKEAFEHNPELCLLSSPLQ